MVLCNRLFVCFIQYFPHIATWDRDISIEGFAGGNDRAAKHGCDGNAISMRGGMREETGQPSMAATGTLMGWGMKPGSQAWLRWER